MTKEFSFTFASEPFEQWLEKNPDVEKLALSGNMSSGEIESFEDAVLQSKIRILHLDEIVLSEHQQENERDYEEYIFDELCLNFSQLSWFVKCFINRKRVDAFILDDDCVYSEDRKSLIHVPEMENYVLPDTVEYIGIAAFSGYDELHNFKFNQSLKEIGAYAFYDCYELENIELPDSLTTLGKSAFCGAGIEKLKLSNNLIAVPDECFLNNDLERLTIPSSVKEIGDESFGGNCIEKMLIPEGVEKIGYFVFERLKYISLPSTLKEIAPDFYYEEFVDAGEYPPYVRVHPDNPIFYAKAGTLYYKDNDKQVLNSPYRDEDDDCDPDGDCSKCKRHCQSKEEVKAVFDEKLPKAEAGDAEAQHIVGVILTSDKWMEPNYEKGMEYIRSAAEQNCLEAIMTLSTYYHEGWDVEQDYEESFRWLQKAAALGDARGMNNLASCYEEGVGTPKNLHKALEWYKKAVEAGYYKASEDVKRLEQLLL